MLLAPSATGEMAEWLKAAASKAVVRSCRTGGSNPPLSAINFCPILLTWNYSINWGCYLYSRWLLVNIDGPFSKYGRTIDLPLT